MVAIPQVQIPDFAGTLMRGEQFQQSRLQALAQQQALEDARQARAVASEVLPQIGTLQGPALIGQLGRLVGADPRFAAFAAPLIQRERDNAELGIGGAPAGGATPVAMPAPMPAGGAARPGAPATAPAELMPLIEEASRETGIPVPILVAKIRQESNFDPNARGRAGEIGLAQIMPATAQRPGFGVQPADPARLAADPRENILFGARYLAARGRAAGVTDWNDPAQVDRALAAYNGGGDPNYVQNVRRWMPGSAPAPAAGGDTIPAQAAAPGGAPGIQRTPEGHIVVPGQNMSMVSRAYAAPPGNERAREIIQRYEAALSRHLQVMNMDRRDPTDSFREETRNIGGRQVAGQVNVRTGQFTPYAGQTERPSEGISVPQARATVARLGPLVASGRLTAEMPEYNDYVMAYEIARAPQQVWVEDPNTPGIQRQITQPGLTLDPARFPPPAAATYGGRAPAPAGAPAPGAAPAEGAPAGAADAAEMPGATPLTRPSPGSAATGEENLSAGYARRMVEAEGLLEQVVRDGHSPGNLRDAAATAIGGAQRAGPVSRFIGNSLMTTQGQLYRQAQEDWVRAKLRRESGAVIGEEEMAREIQVYFPQPGDSPEVIAQKAQARQVAIAAMRQAAGRASSTVPQAAGQTPGPGGRGTDEPPPRGESRRRVRTPEEAAALPPDTEYETPDGRVFRR